MSSNVVSGERPERGRGDLVRDMSSFPICSKKKGVGNMIGGLTLIRTVNSLFNYGMRSFFAFNLISLRSKSVH